MRNPQDFRIGLVRGRGGMNFKFAKAPRESDMLSAIKHLIAEKYDLILQ